MALFVGPLVIELGSAEVLPFAGNFVDSAADSVNAGFDALLGRGSFELFLSCWVGVDFVGNLFVQAFADLLEFCILLKLETRKPTINLDIGYEAKFLMVYFKRYSNALIIEGF